LRDFILVLYFFKIEFLFFLFFLVIYLFFHLLWFLLLTNLFVELKFLNHTFLLCFIVLIKKTFPLSNHFNLILFPTLDPISFAFISHILVILTSNPNILILLKKSLLCGTILHTTKNYIGHAYTTPHTYTPDTSKSKKYIKKYIIIKKNILL